MTNGVDASIIDHSKNPRTYLAEEIGLNWWEAYFYNIRQGLERLERGLGDDLLVYPWCVILYPIGNSVTDENVSMGPGPKSVKRYFEIDCDKTFYFENIHVCSSRTGCMGNGIVATFERSAAGLVRALEFEDYFERRGYGLLDWKKRHANDGLGKGLYGWLASANDLNGQRGGKDDFLIAQYFLQEKSNLIDVRSVGPVGANKMQDREFYIPTDTSSDKSKKGIDIIFFHGSGTARRDAQNREEESQEAVAAEPEVPEQRAQQSADDHVNDVVEHNKKLQRAMIYRKPRSKDLEEKDKYVVNELENTRNCKEMDACAQLSVLPDETKADNESNYDTVNALTSQERTVNDELEAARILLNLFGR